MNDKKADRAKLLQEAIKAFGEAWANGDMPVLETLLSPSYTHNDAFGVHHDRASWLAYARERTGRGTQIDFRSLETRIRGNVAIVTGINDLKGSGVRTAADQQDLSILFTQVWMWTDGRWMREAFQATPISGV